MNTPIFFWSEVLADIKKISTFAAGKSYTASSLSIPPGLDRSKGSRS